VTTHHTGWPSGSRPSSSSQLPMAGSKASATCLRIYIFTSGGQPLALGESSWCGLLTKKGLIFFFLDCPVIICFTDAMTGLAISSQVVLKITLQSLYLITGCLFGFSSKVHRAEQGFRRGTVRASGCQSSWLGRYVFFLLQYLPWFFGSAFSGLALTRHHWGTNLLLRYDTDAGGYLSLSFLSLLISFKAILSFRTIF